MLAAFWDVQCCDYPSWDSASPLTIVFTHSRSHLERKRVFSAANLLKRGVKRKRKLIRLGLAKVSILLCLVRFFKGLDVEKHQNSENTYSLNRLLQSFCN